MVGSIPEKRFLLPYHNCFVLDPSELNGDGDTSFSLRPQRHGGKTKNRLVIAYYIIKVGKKFKAV